jgi:signal transduction histidine kinase
VIGLDAAVAGAWPLALSMALAFGVEQVRWHRRRLTLNRALHELCRPLQALALGADRRGSLDLALVALDDLDRAVNGGQRPLERGRVPCVELVGETVERWRRVAARSGRALELRWKAGSAAVLADRVRVSQALDNLVGNALEHAAGPISIEGTVGARGVRIAVSDGGASASRGRTRPDPRRGHGLEIATRIARAHGGRLSLRRSPAGCTAVLELPLA